MGIKHAFVSAIADGADATLVRPSDWNAEHVLAENASAPPAAAIGYLGQFYYYRAAASSGQLLFCAKDSAGAYEWIVVAQASV